MPSEVDSVIREFLSSVSGLFPGERMEAILFGSFARGDAEPGSDVDVLVLVESPREDILQKGWQIGSAAGSILVDRGILISPIVENRTYFHQHTSRLPFYQNILREGAAIRSPSCKMSAVI